MSGFKGMNRNDKNGMWKEKVSYQGLHQWVRRNLPQPLHCQSCWERKKLEVANISQKYKRDLGDWKWVCRKCHMIEDGRLAAIHNRDYSLNKKQREILRLGRLRRWQ